jgi:hypothetical protein
MDDFEKAERALKDYEKLVGKPDKIKEVTIKRTSEGYEFERGAFLKEIGSYPSTPTESFKKKSVSSADTPTGKFGFTFNFKRKYN